MATIVFSNTGDVDTRVLAELWDGITSAPGLRTSAVPAR